MNLAPCHKCGRPALIGDGPGETWMIGCFRDDCDCEPIRYQANNKRSRTFAVRAWNGRGRDVRSKEVQATA